MDDGTLPVKVSGHQGDASSVSNSPHDNVNGTNNKVDASSVSKSLRDNEVWYFSRKEIETNSPSRRDGMALKKETTLRKSYCRFLKNLGVRLKVPQITIATAIVFCHRFFLRQSHVKNDRWTIATACMFLAGKAEETPRVLQDVAIVSYEIIHKKDVPAAQRKEVCEQQKKYVLSAEELVLSTLNFDLSIGHPYEPLIHAIKKYKVEEVKAQFPQVAWSFVNDCYGTTLCLQYKPRQIAAGAFFLAAEHLTVDLQSYGEGLFQEFDITPVQLEDIRGQMLELYEKKHVSTTQGSIVERSNGGERVHQPVSKEVASTDKCPPSSDTGGGGPSEVNLSQSNDHLMHGDESRPEGTENANSERKAGENQDGYSIQIVTSETIDDVGISKDLQVRPEEVEGKGEKDKKTTEEGIKEMGSMEENDLSEREVEDVELRDEDDKTVEMGSQSSIIATPV
ncbi:unnamed protein product [Eruca vesicaria subsp. sativa]|uniref:Cyclin-like domain-containing protein n=1 Tax=Eruca vesicaria subsp. sativa TaxID=29727 RepID=A0ABC8JXY1_ERUVS|nr:unnamed protein product [Eruca vesicaria subsp. sativa]